MSYNQEFVNLSVHTGSANINTSWTGWHNIINDTTLRPYEPVTAMDSNGTIVIKSSDNSAQITFKSITGNTISGVKVYGELLWKKIN